VPTLRARVSTELSGDYPPGKPMRISRAPGRLDVMGGIADYTGSMVCEATLDRASAVALTTRDDRFVQVFSFNLMDEHQPFAMRIPLDTLANQPIESLRAEFNQPGRKWGGYLTGCLAILHEQGILDLNDSKIRGVNLAVLGRVPLGAGVSSSAALEVATMMNLLGHFGLADDPSLEPMRLAELCQMVENRVVGAPCGIMDQVSSIAGQAGSLLRMVCQPHDLLPGVNLPPGIRAVGINSNVKHSVGGGMYGTTRCAAFMGHKIILEKMREMGTSAGQTLVGDPMKGYLANLDPDDYKKYFRPYLPAQITGADFVAKFGDTIDKATRVNPIVTYHVLQATDHHVLEARRVRNFIDFIEQAAREPFGTRPAGAALDKAGHLMYASHLSYTNDALLGADECDLLVKLARDREKLGIYGAKITGGGSGGTVAMLCDQGPKTDAAIAEIMSEYQRLTGRKPEAFLGTSPGAWQVGTAVV
jgi:L-arabinokinase